MKLLFITSNRLGDAVLSTGLLAAAIARFQPTAVTIACGPIPAPLFKNVPNLTRIIPLKKEKMNGHWLKLWRETVLQKWDFIIDLRNSFVSYALMAGKVYRFTKPDKTKHKSAQLADVLKLPEVPFNKIWLSEEVRARAKELLPEGAPILALCPTANWGPKTWPAENFVALARKLPFTRIAVFGASNEREQASPIIAALRENFEVIDVVGKADPLEAAACLERAALCVANDSGLMHIAAAVGCATVGLFGPSNDVEYSPHGPRTAFIRALPFHGLDNTPEPYELMKAIGVDMVFSLTQWLRV